ncbi:unnamed protein product, partial [Ectocarpus fasciculatus]
GLSDRSGRSTRQLGSRDQGDQASDIHPGEGADEYAIRRSGSGNRPSRFSNGVANGNAGGGGGAGGATATTAANGSSGGARGGGGEEDMDIPDLATPRDVEDGDMSFYDGNSRLEEEVVDNFADIPTPAPRGAGAGGRGSGAVAGPDGGRTFRTQRSDSSEGWVDQYTSSSLVVSKAAPSASAQQQQQQQAAAEAARGGVS